MSAPSEERNERDHALTRVFGSTPWLKSRNIKKYRVKLFKSGNSIAVRIPAELGFKAGTEMDMEVENDEHLTLEPIDRPKRKFNVNKVAGSATSLRPISRKDRIFQDRPLAWPSQPEGVDKPE